MDRPNEKATVRHPTPRIDRGLVSAAAVTALATAAVVGIAASAWIDTPFPGFFVLPNRVVPSIGRAAWPASRAPVYQKMVAAVDDTPVRDGAEVYHRVAQQPPGTAFAYTLESGTATKTFTVHSRVFSQADYWAIFGSYIATGLLYLLLGLLGALQFPGARLGRALLLVGTAGGIYSLSAVGLYDPDAAIRIHVLAEAFFPAALVYLALVFPHERRALTTPAAAVAWWLSLALGVAYQLLLNQPGPYSAIHAACELYLGAAGIGLVVRLILARAQAAQTAGPALRSALAGALLGLGVPAIVFTISGASGGSLPVNVCTTTAFLFPLSFGYGLVRERLGERHATLASAEGSCG